MDTGKQEGEAEIYPILSLPEQTNMNRRGFLGVGIATSTALGLLAGCSDEKEITAPIVNPTSQAKPTDSPSCNFKSASYSGVKNIVFNLNDKIAATWPSDLGKKMLTLWEIPSGKLLHRLKHDGRINKINRIENAAIAFSPSGDKVYCSFGKNYFFNWDTKTGQELPPIQLENKEDNIDLLHTSPDGKSLIIGTNSTHDLGGSQLYIMDTVSGQINTLGERSKHNKIIVICFSHDASRLIVRSQYGVILILQMPNGKLIKSLQTEYWKAPIASHPFKDIIAEGDSDAIKLWDIKKGKLLQIIKTGKEIVSQLYFTPDGTLISSGDTIKFWNLETLAITKAIKPRISFGIDGFMSNNGQYLLTVESGVRLWDLSNDSFLTCLDDKETKIRNRGGNDTYCSCNKVCSCVPVCQAHEVLNPNPIIAYMAEQLLCYMGRNQFPYMQWAANESGTSVRKRIDKIIAEIKKGRKADFTIWPELSQLKPLLEHKNEIVCIMAAQIIHIKASTQKISIEELEKSKISRLLSLAKRRHQLIKHEFDSQKRGCSSSNY